MVVVFEVAGCGCPVGDIGNQAGLEEVGECKVSVCICMRRGKLSRGAITSGGFPEWEELIVVF